jgi:hypothetical protein
MRASLLPLVAVCLVLLVASPVPAQESSASSGGLKGDWDFRTPQPTGLRNLMLLDSSRLTVSHSLSMAYATGGFYGSGESPVTGLFLNHLNYRVSDNMQVWADLGVGFRPSLGMDSDTDPRVVLPGFGLHYRPSEKFHLDIIVQNPSYYYNPYRYWRR